MIDYTRLSTYDYDLPAELIAQTPLDKRDESRLLCFNMDTKEISDEHFFDIKKRLKKGDVLVLNNTRVIPCRLFGVKEGTGAKVEIFLLKRLNLTDFEVLARPGKRLKKGARVKFSDELACEILGDNEETHGKKVRFIFDGVFEEILDKIGLMPLPPYIKEKLEDKERYQTVYSKFKGSSAAPTAGLHFTKELLEELKNMGVIITYVLLHVGLGTFRPVSEENILNHDMHSEYYEVSHESADIINKAIDEKRRVICVGTTSLRTLESAGKSGRVKAGTGNTKLFCYPPYNFKIVDGLITNFHLPKSTLIMLVCAFAGFNNTMKVYKHAVENKYRFFSFGDSSFFYRPSVNKKLEFDKSKKGH